MPKRNKKRRIALLRVPKAQPYFDERAEEEGVEREGEEDEEFLHEGLEEGRLGFLTRLKAKDLMTPISKKDKGKSAIATPGNQDDVIDKQRRKRQRQEGSGSEAEFESEPRRSVWLEEEEEEENLHHPLPLKGRHGLIPRPAVPKPHVVDSASESDTSADEDDDEEDMTTEKQSYDEAPPGTLSAAELLAQRAQKLREKKEAIAVMGSLLVEGPEDNIDQLRKLCLLCTERDPDIALTVRKLAMVSLVSVFRDIAPSYRIRELTEVEKAVKVSRDVRRLRNFEQSFLANYQQFLGLLDEIVKVGLGEGGPASEGGPPERKKRRRRRRGKEGVEEDGSVAMLEGGQELSPEGLESCAEVALQCLCDLVTALSHFNFRSNILAVLVPRMNSVALGGKVSKMCCAAIEKLFENDVVGEVSLEAVQLIAKMIKSKNYKTKPVVLRTFLHLHIHHVDEPVGAAGSSWGRREGKSKIDRKKEIRAKLAKMTKKQKKRMKMETKLERELKQAEAVESKEKKMKVQTETVKVVFLTYFRILKHTRHSPLLQPVLEGLAKFAHLINVDFFQDLMSVLHSIAEAGWGLSNRECMQCVLTAFEILSGQGASLNIDPRQFYRQLYEAILQLDTCSSSGDVVLAVVCLDRMIRKRRQVSLQRVLGFVKRLSTVTLQLLPGACLAVMATIRKFIHSYSKCEQLLDVESSAGGGGVYQPDVPDPEMSHADSTVLWELTLLTKHYDSSVRDYAAHLLMGAPLQGKGALHPDLARRSPKDLVDLMGLEKSNPMAGVPAPPSHPKATKAQSRGKSPRGGYYSSTEIMSDKIKKAEERSIQLAQEALQGLENSLSRTS